MWFPKSERNNLASRPLCPWCGARGVGRTRDPHPGVGPTWPWLSPPTLGSLGLGFAPGACSLGVLLAGGGARGCLVHSSAGWGQGCPEIMLGGRGWASILEVPLWAPQGPLPTCPGKPPSSCFLEQLEAVVSGRPVGRALVRVRMEGPAPQQKGPRPLALRPGAPGRLGWPGQPGSLKGHGECSAGASHHQGRDNVVSI